MIKLTRDELKERFPQVTEIKKVVFKGGDFFLVLYKGVSFHIVTFSEIGSLVSSVELETYLNGVLMNVKTYDDNEVEEMLKSMDKTLKEYDDIS